MPLGTRAAPPSPPLAPPLPPPPAPPLPTGKYVQRAATAFGRLAHPFFIGSRPPSAQGHRDARGRSDGIRPASRRSSSPLASRSTTHKTGIPIAAVDISPERTHAILAGKDILKTIKISQASCTEDVNIRSKLIAYASNHHASREAASAQHRDQLTAKDVKWSCGNFSTTIATAAANGKIVVYDIHRPSIEIGRLHEHARQVHKLAFNPHQGALLISGSQDGTVRMWDMRELRTDRAARIGGSIRRFIGHNDGVRDLKWSPSDGVEFATATDAGTIQRWDFRKENAPLLKLNAHDKPCMSLDWHPGGRYLASGSADKTIKVWDFRSSDRRMKPQWQIRAPQGVMNIRWRPEGSNFSSDGVTELKQTTSLASSYDERDPRIHIWDFRRPHVPLQEIDKYDTPATGILWHSERLLWSVGMAGVFTQTDLNYVPKPMDRLSTNVLAPSADAGICFFSCPRPAAKASVAEVEDYFLRSGSNRDGSGEKLSVSHEGSIDESAHVLSGPKKRRPKLAAPRLTSQTSSTIGGVEDSRLTETSFLEPVHFSSQVAAIGRISGIMDYEVFELLARSYKLPAWTSLYTDESILASMDQLCEENARAAAHIGQQRLARTWRIVSHAVQVELSVRLEELQRKHRTAKSLVSVPAPATIGVEGLRSPVLAHIGEVSKALHGINTQSESGSNAQTPLAHPVREMPLIPASDQGSLEPDQSTDGVPLWQLRRASVQIAGTQMSARDQSESKPNLDSLSANGSRAKDLDQESSSIANFPELERQMEERRNAMNNYRARPRTLLRFDGLTENGASNAQDLPPLVRHDSNESFQMLSVSTDSDPRSMALAGSFSESQSVDDSGGNSVGSSLTQDPVAAIHMRQSQLRHSHPVAIHSNNATESQLPHPHESPLFDNMSFPMETDANTGVEGLGIEGLRSIKRPDAHIAPIRHNEDNDNVAKRSSTQCTPLLLANPALHATSSAPWTLFALLPSLLEYHLETLCDTQLPSMLAIILFPMCPALFSHSQPPPTYILTYHEMLTSSQLFVEAAALRKSAQFIFPDIGLETTVEQGRGTASEKTSLWCNQCGKPNKGNVRGWCKRCCTEWAECGVCELVLPPSAIVSGRSEYHCDESFTGPSASTALWSWCQGCGHGGHTICLRSWWSQGSKASSFADSKGVCPIAGCGHACVTGSGRDAQIAAIAAAGKRERSSNVARDSWIAGESRAVEAATRRLSARGSNVTGIKTSSGLGPPFGNASGRPPVEEAVIIVDPEQGNIGTSREGGPLNFPGGSRSLSGGGRSLSGGGRRVRLALPGTTPPASATASTALRELHEHQDEHFIYR